MLDAMFSAQVGDDVFGEDPSIHKLEAYSADLFGKEAALFCPSGTMTNQIAIKIHTEALDDMICDHNSHVYRYETGGYGFNSGISVSLIQGSHGKITASQIEEVIHEDYDWLPKSKLVVLENSCNKGGGSYYTLDEIRPIYQLCQERKLILHLDGARLFNVLVETNESTQDVGALFDSISICLSKGLGAPVGSLLIGSARDIKRARRFRKVLGGGMRQAGYLAAAGLYALRNNIDRLKIDNDRAKEIAGIISDLPWVKSISPVKTNILIFQLHEGRKASEFVNKLKALGINSSPFGPDKVRFVFHLDISNDMITDLIKTLKTLRF